MFNQWPVIKDWGKWFEENWNGSYLTTCFSRSKETIYLYFEKEKKQLYLKFEFLNEGTFLLNEFSKYKKTDLVQFPEITNQAVSSVNYYDNERSIIINFYNGFSFWVRFYGNMGNIILMQNGEAKKIFRTQSPNDLQANINQIDPTKNIIPKTNPFTIKLIRNETGRYQIIYDHLLSEKKILYIAADVHDAIDNFSKLYFRYKHTYNKNHEQLLKCVQKEKSLSRNLQKYEERLAAIIHSRPLDEIAHIIIANISEIKREAEEVSLLDFYTNTYIQVKLKPKLSPQQNAEILFRKQKNQKIEVGFLEQSINKCQTEIKTLQKQISYLKDHLYVNAISNQSTAKSTTKSDSKISGIRQIKIEGWDILIGKNSESNDKLTHQIAHKNDLWFHAFGVSGSHVIIRNGGNAIPPAHIIYKASALAAANSKSKHCDMVPVIKTYKKYVRRPKGANPGQVTIEQYEIVDVKPNNEI